MTLRLRHAALPHVMLAAWALLSLATGDAAAQSRDASSARPVALRFVTLLGHDTIAVEEARWAGDSLRGVILTQDPELIRVEYLVHTTPGRAVRAVHLVESTLGSQTWRVRRRVLLEARGDSIRMLFAPDSVVRTVFAPGALLSLNGSGALLWLAAQRFDALGVDSSAIPWIAPLGGPGGRFIARRRDAAHLEYRLSGGFSVLRRDAAGRVLGVDARATTLKVEIVPASAGVSEAVQARWAQGRAGSLSPRDTVHGRVGDAELWIDYGRPAVRGRDVFGVGVLGDSVWRTGANAATQLRTTHDLRFATGSLPAGTYSVFTRIAADRSELIFNGRAGIWGTQYSASSDVLRVPLERRRAPFAERLTFMIDSVPPALVFRWADQEFRVPFVIGGTSDSIFTHHPFGPHARNPASRSQPVRRLRP